MNADIPALLHFTDAELRALAPLLMAAALSDGSWDGAETRAIRDLLMAVGRRDHLTADILEALIGYEEGAFDLHEALAAIDVSTDARRRAVLALVGAVVCADGRLDVSEQEFFGRVAAAVGASAEELADLNDDMRRMAELVGQ